ncbi:DUF3488 and transglutaminase-like domain-containing protein [Streptomyces sodiiphilus]|uniref:DUF3488 and transglutaminase-like domain-containing protein n=1 Tax=Streptomyces sodiiphilus TaxID=226217 RepID=A0ABP5AQL8_9ACTN
MTVGQLRITAAAWAATLAAAAAMLPVVEGAGWLVQAAVLLAIQSGAGAAARWQGLRGPLVLSAQVLVSALLITVVTVPEHATAGVLPGPGALDALGLLLSTGAEDVARYVAPAPLTPGIQLMLVGGVLLIGLLTDLLAVTLHSAASAGLPLLALYSVAAGVGQDGPTWPYFLCAAAGFLLLLLVEGRDRLARWGAHLSRPGGAERSVPALPRSPSGRRIGALTLGIAVLAPALLPSLDGGLLDLSGSGGGRAAGSADALASVNPVVALQDQLNRPRDRTVLTYRSDTDRPQELYLRLVALDAFDGEEWRSSRWWSDTAPAAPWPVPGLAPGVATSTVITSVQAGDTYAQPSVPVPYPAVGVFAAGDWAFDQGSQTLVSGDRDLTVQGLGYQVEHLLVEPTAQQLAMAPPPADEELRRHFTEVPGALPAEVGQLAREVTAGAVNDHERAVALQNWFTRDGGFRYDTDVRAGTGSEAIVSFLQQREGFCIHFAFAMAAMARTLDIPAQVAVGFTPGRQTGAGTYQVGIHNAHAWPELYFEGVGWVRFEPTPGQGSTPAHTRPDSASPDRDSPSRPDRPEQQPDPQDPRASEENEERCDPALEPGACPAGPELDLGTGSGSAGAAPLPVVWVAGGALLLVLLAAAPPLWRAGARSRRLRPSAGPEAAWQELRDTAWDLGLPPHRTDTPRQTARRLSDTCRLTGPAREAVHELALAVEEDRYAPAGLRKAPRPAADAVRTACAGLRAAAGRRQRLRAALLPHSAVRVIRAGAAQRMRAARAAGRAGRLLPGRRQRGT